MITGDVNNSFFSTGCFSISSSLASLDFVTDSLAVNFVVELWEVKGAAVTANPPAMAFEINFRRFVFI